MPAKRPHGKNPRSQLRISRGHLKGRVIRFTAEEDLRPTLGMVRAAVFNILGPAPEMGFIDVFAGSGIMGFEAYSQGYSPVLLLETHPPTLAALRKNGSQLQAELSVIGRSAVTLTKDQISTKPYVIYADPPFQAPQLHGEISAFFGECPHIEANSRYIAESESPQPPEVHPAWRLEDTRRYGRIYLYWFIKLV